MKNFKIYNGIKRAIAGVLVPISLMATTVLLSSCSSDEDVTTYEEETIEDLEVILNESDIEVSVKYYRFEYEKEATICIIGKESKEKRQYTEEKFYKAFNQLLGLTNKEIESLSIELINYDNQIDFRKVQIPKRFKEFSVKVSHSKNVNIDELIPNITKLLLIDGNINNFEDVVRQLNEQKGELVFGENLDLSSLKEFIDKNPQFTFYHIEFNSGEKAKMILPYLNAYQVFVNLSDVENSITVNPKIPFLSFSTIENDLCIAAGDGSKVTLFVEELDLNCPIIESLNNVNRVVIYPKINQQNEIYSIEITENGCIASSFYGIWNIPYDVIDGKKEYYLYLEERYQKSLYIHL